MRFFGALAFVCALAACQPVAEPAAPPAGKVLYLGQALYDDAVFDRDVLAMKSALSQHYGGLERAVIGGNVLPEMPPLSEPGKAVAALAAEAEDGRDLVVVMLTSHGRPGEMAVSQPGEAPRVLSAARLAQILQPLENDLQVVILQACYSGSLIPALRHPNRIVLTAARADRPSFGCQPDEKNTWFIKALSAELAAPGSWQSVFQRTRARVRAYEAAQGVTQHSEPQSDVGANMAAVWKGLR